MRWNDRQLIIGPCFGGLGLLKFLLNLIYHLSWIEELGGFKLLVHLHLSPPHRLRFIQDISRREPKGVTIRDLNERQIVSLIVFASR